MATTKPTPQQLPEAPWKSSFHAHISKMSSPEFVFSTVHPAPKGSPVPYVPRARFCIFRGFWGELPENKHNDAPKNERVFASELPTFTTDQRMMKTFDIFNSSKGHADREELTRGSGGGGPCEAVWWVKEEDLMMQWRMKGEAFIVGPDIDGDAAGGESNQSSSGVITAKAELMKRMRVLKEDGVDEWSWGKEMTGHFGNVSPGMRGTFANPPPGQPVDQPYDEKNLTMGSKIEDLEDEVSRSNFRVVVIRPQEVESIDLSDPSKARRQVYTFDDSTQEWSHQECWP